MSHLTFETMKKSLPQVLAAIPPNWRGTTYNNSNLLGRKVFCDNLIKLIESKSSSGDAITTADLHNVGNAEDYLRVSSNISTTLELALALQRGYDSVHRVFTWSSTTMPIIAVSLTSSGKTVHLYTGESPDPFTQENHRVLNLLGIKLEVHAGEAKENKEGIVLVLKKEPIGETQGFVDGTITPYVLYIENPDTISESEILVIRKRMATPVTTPMAEEMLQKLAGVQVTANQEKPEKKAEEEFNAHLQTLSGTDVNTSCNPVSFAAGLPALASLMVTLIARGGADVMQCSTAYGGSSQLVDILNERTQTLNKHTFDIQGDKSMVEAISGLFKDLASRGEDLMPTTLLFMEVPTNPDMKVPDLSTIAEAIKSYKATTKRQVIVLIDATFAPGSEMMKKAKEIDPELIVIVFLSMSKSISRGLTTAGALVANHTEEAISVLHSVAEIAEMMDTKAKPDQMIHLVNNHSGVTERCAKAYKVAVQVGDRLREEVKKHRDADMRLAFVTPEQATLGFTTSTFSFNLPGPVKATDAEKAILAQQFVDLLTHHSEFKPCVSFGQDNNLVYATVPATSTQGAIKEEDKGKQAVGGVQLVRLSFPPTCNVDRVCEIVATSVATIYS